MFGVAIECADGISALLGDADFRTQVTTILDPKAVPYIVVFVSLVSKFARNRTLGRGER